MVQSIWLQGRLTSLDSPRLELEGEIGEQWLDRPLRIKAALEGEPLVIHHVAGAKLLDDGTLSPNGPAGAIRLVLGPKGQGSAPPPERRSPFHPASLLRTMTTDPYPFHTRRLRLSVDSPVTPVLASIDLTMPAGTSDYSADRRNVAVAFTRKGISEVHHSTARIDSSRPETQAMEMNLRSRPFTVTRRATAPALIMTSLVLVDTLAVLLHRPELGDSWRLDPSVLLAILGAHATAVASLAKLPVGGVTLSLMGLLRAAGLAGVVVLSFLARGVSDDTATILVDTILKASAAWVAVVSLFAVSSYSYIREREPRTRWFQIMLAAGVLVLGWLILFAEPWPFSRAAGAAFGMD